MERFDFSNHLVVLDGTALLFRAYFAGFRIQSPRELEVGAVFGVAQFLHRFMVRFHPRYVVVAHDAPGPTFRHQQASFYKAHRGAVPRDLRPQFDLVRQLCTVLGFPSYWKEGYEADDLMATLAMLSHESGLDCTLVSEDKDLCQLVRDDLPSTTLYSQRKETVYDEEGVVQRMGVPPSTIVDLLAMVGDSSDNIPGIRGVGDKTARALLQEFGSLEELYAHLEHVEELPLRGAKRIRQLLEEGREDVLNSRELIKLHHDVPLELTADKLKENTLWRGPLGLEAQHFFHECLGYSGPLTGFQRLGQEYDEF